MILCWGSSSTATNQEAKGLEYDNIILYNFTSATEERFRDITPGVSAEDVLAACPRINV